MYQDSGPDADRQILAKQLFDDEYCVNAGRFVIQAWFNRGRPEFSDSDFEQALSMGSLTVTLASPASLDQAHQKLRQRLRSRKMENLL